MRKLLIAALVVAGGAVASDDPFLKGEELKAAIGRDCADGCITFNRQEAQELQEALERIIAQKQQEAYEAGIRHQRQACKSLI